MKKQSEKYADVKPFDPEKVILHLKPDKNPDPRNYKYKTLITGTSLLDIPSKVDLRPYLNEVRQQGSLGSCQSFATITMIEYAWYNKRKELQDFSEMFNYYYVRAMNNQQNYNVGAYVIDAIKTPLRDGFCPDQYWPYLESDFTKKPALIANVAARIFPLYKPVSGYYQLSINTVEVKHALSHNQLVGFGMQVYDNFMNISSDGFVRVPAGNNLGGHMITIVGYDDDMKCPSGQKGAFIVRNSWGKGWGDQGYFYFPYNLFNENLVFDAYCFTY